MKNIIALALVVSVTGCASVPTEKWTTQQKVLGGTLAALNAADYATTKKCLSMPNCREANPLLGEHPSDTKLAVFKVAFTGGQLMLADMFPEQRTKILWIMNGLTLGVVANNVKTIGWKMPF